MLVIKAKVVVSPKNRVKNKLNQVSPKNRVKNKLNQVSPKNRVKNKLNQVSPKNRVKNKLNQVSPKNRVKNKLNQVSPKNRVKNKLNQVSPKNRVKNKLNQVSPKNRVKNKLNQVSPKNRVKNKLNQMPFNPILRSLIKTNSLSFSLIPILNFSRQYSMAAKHPLDACENTCSSKKLSIEKTADSSNSNTTPLESQNSIPNTTPLESQNSIPNTTPIESQNSIPNPSIITSISTPIKFISTDIPLEKNKAAFEFFENTLLGSKYFLAPMVDQSELSWRILSRRYGSQVCFTPMFHAKMFSDPNNTKYFNEMWQTDKFDRPLIAQLVEDSADAVDINLGCPQHIARRGKYGAYLMDEWDLIFKIINNAATNLKIPITAKIRIYPELEKTIKYAQMLVNAGAKMLTVHGRLREQKGHKTGLCDWSQIKAVRQNVNVPVVANGGLLYFEDIDLCIQETGVQAVMVAEPNLYNPAFYTNKVVNSFDIALEYLEICKTVSTKPSYIRAHLFKLFKPSLPKHTDLRTELAQARTVDEFTICVEKLKLALLQDANASDFDPNNIKLDEHGYKIYPHWVCQPLIRMKFDPKTSSCDIPLGRSVS
ncbi:hypothetical protein BB561_004846 [Smittium simulii]|uniref:tRNA-dihydrouridine(16/17) synthase [NAD(P)(+)] n=1 Tax=Smittium simulii TaxID=133385 RepID=A0A2T9YDS8_9FUNG|nr:hypothetical protein BB561_004846 [Smittium simulii]